jgi:HK97 family phage major capsid protein
MAYNNQLSRTDIAPLIPEDVLESFLVDLTDTSVALTAFRKVPVAQSQTRFPILSALPIAYWVAGDTGLKQTTEMAWGNKFLNVEELAAIAPIPERVMDDLNEGGVGGGIDIWSEIQPTIVAEMARVIDQAIFFGVNAPASFPQNVLAACQAVLPTANTHTEGAAQAAGGIQDDIDQCYGQLEPQGFEPDRIIAARTLRSKLRRARTTIGERLEGLNPDLTEYLGIPISHPMRGMWPTATGGVSPEAFIGEFETQFVVGIRKDITIKMLDQAVIQDNTGAIVYNLAQQDMVAARFTMRVGWQVANTITWDQPDPTKRYPVSALMLA